MATPRKKLSEQEDLKATSSKAVKIKTEVLFKLPMRLQALNGGRKTLPRKSILSTEAGEGITVVEQAFIDALLEVINSDYCPKYETFAEGKAIKAPAIRVVK